MNPWTLRVGDKLDWLSERACQYGDGLFETVAVTDGKPRLWAYHLQRLHTGCERLGLPQPDPQHLARAVESACKEQPTIGLKLTWTAGRSARGYRRHRPLQAQGFIQRFAWTPPREQRPWRLRVCAHRLSENPVLAGIKHMNRLDQVLGRSEWDDPDIEEGLMLGQDGRLVCGTMSNIVIDRAGQLSTPAVDSAGVAGVVRSCLIDEATKLGDSLVPTRLTQDDLRTADAVYLTNALIGVKRAATCAELGFDLDYPEHPLIAIVRRRALGNVDAGRGED